MKMKDLDRLARRHGISLTRPSPGDGEVPISNDTKKKVLSALRVNLAPKTEKSEKAISSGKGKRHQAIPQSFVPQFLEGGRVWGISLQLYELRSARNWGIGDFEDLKVMADLVVSLGGDFIGLNPLHAPFLGDPARCSPYEPSSRQHLNPLYIAVDKAPGFQPSRDRDQTLDELRQTDLVDYAAVAAVKLEALRDAWQVFPDAPADVEAEFDAFIEEGGEPLFRHALFESLSLAMVRQGASAGWHGWPEDYQDCASRLVRKHAADQQNDIRYHMWLQWLAHRQLQEAADHARRAGLRIGLYLDLAVGEAVDGSATWSERHVYIDKATVGSPPDPFAHEGQDWHLAAFHPDHIAAGTNAPFRRMVSTAMRYAGAVRIDHAAALRRLFLVPIDSRPDGGAYVDYPQDALLQILAETSAMYRCLVIGEDLGMLPPGLQDDLEKARILSYRILSYERGEDAFKPADAYPALALACISTHDHQTLTGWWRGADIKARAEHGIVPEDVSRDHVEERKDERRYLLSALRMAGITPPTRLGATSKDTDKLETLVVGAHRFIARTPSMLAAVRLADLTDEKRPTNIPGTSDGYPNWRPKLSIAVEDLPDVPLLQAVAHAMRQERPRPEA